MRRVTILLVVALVAASLGVAGPARAADAADCFTISQPPDINSVEIDGVTITIHPDQVRPDALAQVNYYVFYLVVGRILCLEGGIVTGKLPLHRGEDRRDRREPRPGEPEPAVRPAGPFDGEHRDRRQPPRGRPHCLLDTRP